MINIFFKFPHIRLFSGSANQTPQTLVHNFADTMLSHGVRMVNNEKEANVVIITSDGWAPSGDIYSILDIKLITERIGKPVIILERNDSAKTWLRDDRTVAKNVIAIFKNRKTRNIEIEDRLDFHDKIRSWDAPDFSITEQLSPKKKKATKKRPEFIRYKGLVAIRPEIYKKIHCVLWDFYSSHLNRNKCSFYRDREPNPFEGREIDVFCVNREDKGFAGDAIRQHAKSEIRKWGVGKIEVSTSLPKLTYDGKFKESKMCVGCWGYGEWVHIDGYALYNKTILIKPNSDYIYQWPDIYRSGETYVPCKPDYSDLTKVLNEVYSNYEGYKDMMDYNRNMLIEANEDEALKFFCKKVIEVCK